MVTCLSILHPLWVTREKFLLSLCHIFWTPSCTQEVLQTCGGFIPGKGAQSNHAEDRLQAQAELPVARSCSPNSIHYMSSESTHQGLSGKAWVPWRPPWDSGAAPQGHDLGGATGELS